jgi:hypothetical protein
VAEFTGLLKLVYLSYTTLLEVKMDQYGKFSYTYQKNSISKIIRQFSIKVIPQIDRDIALVVSC